MTTLLGACVTLIAGLSVCLMAIGLLSILRLEGWLASLLGTYVVAFAVIVLTAEILSELHAVSRQGFLITHGSLVVLTLPLWVRHVRPFVQEQWEGARQALRALRDAVREDRALLVLSLAVLLASVLGAALIIIVPPNTWDSFMYHLSRAAMWLQQGTLHHFPTPLSLRNAYPINAEVAQLWLMALWGSDRLTAYLQWGAALVTMLSIYGTARSLGFSRAGAIFAALIWSTFTIVVVQATSTKNDLVLAALCSVAFYFLLKGLQRPHPRLPGELVLFGLAIGLAIGTKLLAVLVIPGIVALALVLLVNDPRRYALRLIYAAAWSMAGLIALGAYAYVQNWLNYGALSGPVTASLNLAIPTPTWNLFVSNLARMAYNGLDLGGLPYSIVNALQPFRIRLGEWAFEALRINPNPPEAFELNWPFTFTLNIQMIPREDASWYGPLGWLLLAPVMGRYLIPVPRKHQSMWRWATAMTAALYVLGFAATIYWLPWQGRMLLIPVSIGAALLAGFYDGSARFKPLRWVVVAIGLVVLCWSATQNFHKPLWGYTTIWGMDTYDKRTIQAPEMASLYRDFDAAIPERTRVGVVGAWPSMRWDYLFRGPHLQRTLIWLGEALPPITGGILEANDLDYLLFVAEPADVVVSTLEVHSLGTAWDLRWFWVQAPAQD